jgi:hypothetical protein
MNERVTYAAGVLASKDIGGAVRAPNNTAGKLITGKWQVLRYNLRFSHAAHSRLNPGNKERTCSTS